MKPAKNLKIELTPRQARALLNLIACGIPQGIDIVDITKAHQTLNAAFGS
jgi:hypothetical protein